MKIARFTAGGSDPQFGIIDDDELVVLVGDPMFQGYESTGERVALGEARLLAPVIPRSKIVGVGLNYSDHVAESGAETPAEPVVFLKPNTAVIGPGDAIQMPPVEGPIDHEAELAIVIGAVAKRVRAEDADDVIFGYTIANDVTARALQQADGQWARAKGFDTFCPIGPVIETELDPRGSRIQSFVNGERRLTGSTRDMITGIPELVEFVSNIWTLLPGDLILTGTPAGRGTFVHGQTIDIDIEGIGRLTNPARNRA